jgi:hypothetical protein
MECTPGGLLRRWFYQVEESTCNHVSLMQRGPKWRNGEIWCLRILCLCKSDLLGYWNLEVAWVMLLSLFFIFKISVEFMYGYVMLCGRGIASVPVRNGVTNKLERCDNNGLMVDACFSKFVDGVDPFNACVDNSSIVMWCRDSSVWNTMVANR